MFSSESCSLSSTPSSFITEEHHMLRTQHLIHQDTLIHYYLYTHTMTPTLDFFLLSVLLILNLTSDTFKMWCINHSCMLTSHHSVKGRERTHGCVAFTSHTNNVILLKTLPVSLPVLTLPALFNLVLVLCLKFVLVSV